MCPHTVCALIKGRYGTVIIGHWEAVLLNVVLGQLPSRLSSSDKQPYGSTVEAVY